MLSPAAQNIASVPGSSGPQKVFLGLHLEHKTKWGEARSLLLGLGGAGCVGTGREVGAACASPSTRGGQGLSARGEGGHRSRGRDSDLGCPREPSTMVAVCAEKSVAGWMFLLVFRKMWVRVCGGCRPSCAHSWLGLARPTGQTGERPSPRAESMRQALGTGASSVCLYGGSPAPRPRVWERKKALFLVSGGNVYAATRLQAGSVLSPADLSHCRRWRYVLAGGPWVRTGLPGPFPGLCGPEGGGGWEAGRLCSLKGALLR